MQTLNILNSEMFISFTEFILIRKEDSFTTIKKMAFKIINEKFIEIQYTLPDFIGMVTWKVIDRRTQEGEMHYKRLYTLRPKRLRKERIIPLPDIQYLFKFYNERDCRLFAGFLAHAFGPGGVLIAARLTGLDEKTVRKRLQEILSREDFQKQRVRRPGGGRPAKSQEFPAYEKNLHALIADEIAGDPMTELRWTRKTLRWLKKELQAGGMRAALSTIRTTLKGLHVSLKKNNKCKNTRIHPERDLQFRYLNKLKH